MYVPLCLPFFVTVTFSDWKISIFPLYSAEYSTMTFMEDFTHILRDLEQSVLHYHSEKLVIHISISVEQNRNT